PGPAPTGRQFTYSFNFGATSDYVFRGFSQSRGDPAYQGGVDIGYGIFYAGVWGSGIDFRGTPEASHEVDFYAGIKPTWGPVTFDLGVIYYSYPNAKDPGAELDYVELKMGASTTIQKFSFGGTVFYSPEYTGKTGKAWILEGTAGYELAAFHGITPTIGGAVGTVLFDQANQTDYAYWNLGVAFAIDKLTIDLRYWDTDLPNATCRTAFCDERFVATVKITLP
ncbi:MAG: TorF family putative porin, partial [Hyphomicrobiaceae bacterium]|nr:TorF family putative porin [Hyphomicrobiaceae bacterium]